MALPRWIPRARPAPAPTASPHRAVREGFASATAAPDTSLMPQPLSCAASMRVQASEASRGRCGHKGRPSDAAMAHGEHESIHKAQSKPCVQVLLTLDRQNWTEVTRPVMALTSTPKATAALNIRAPSRCTGRSCTQGAHLLQTLPSAASQLLAMPASHLRPIQLSTRQWGMGK